VLSRAREWVAPAYLFLCLIIGGSAQGIWANMLLQLVGLAIIAWAAASGGGPLGASGRKLFLIVVAGLAILVSQLVPLPASTWATAGGRHAIASTYSLLGLETPWFPLSLAPYDTLRSLLTLIPPLAMLCAMLRLKAYRRSWLAFAVLSAAFCGIILGILQVASSEPENSPWYLYAQSNFGAATGFFANANHMATLLVVSLPFLAGLLRAARGRNVHRNSALLALAVAAALVILVGIVLNRSLAGYVLAVPVVAGSAILVMPSRSPVRRWVALVGAVCLVVALAGLESSSIRPKGFGAEAQSSVESREEILATTWAATKDFLPIGSGVGTFRHVYDLYENPNRVIATYVVHAHNDYAELALEAGLPGVVLLIVFLAWWAVAVWNAWRSPDAGPFIRAASIASAAILVHSLVDFPLRTAAVSATFAMCLALLSDRRAITTAHASDLRPTRHISIG
jgi:O-antigen ligase